MGVTEVFHRSKDPAEDHDDHHHRNVKGGAARAAVFGVSDGLVSNVSLMLGVAGATPGPGVVRLAGLAGLLSGACSMAAGEYISVKAHRELVEREIEVERHELERRPEKEQRELARNFRRKGVDAQVADDMAAELSRDPETALEAHAREELGVDPNDLGSPARVAISSFVSFAVGAFVPLLPWLFARGNGAVVASVVLGALAALAVGASLARFTGRSMALSASRQLGVAAAAAAVTYAVGAAIGTTL